MGRIDAVLSMDRHANITPDELARKRSCGYDTTVRTLRVTTQSGHLTCHSPISQMAQVRLPESPWPTAQPTLTRGSEVKSVGGNICGNVVTYGRFTYKR